MSDSTIATMFDRISPKYDALNHLLSLNIDKVWRRKAAKAVSKNHPQTILDLATGTADLAIALAKYNPQANIVGMDIAEKMLAIGEEKVKRSNLDGQIELLHGDAAALPFNDNSFDAVTVAFGVRNFEELSMGLSEISRVLKSEGQAFILEFSMPQRFPVKQLYRLYFKYLLPFFGRIVSKDKSAYSYLPDSVERFPAPGAFLEMLAHHNLKNGHAQPMTFGIATLYATIKS